jgi:hypothetical protein
MTRGADAERDNAGGKTKEEARKEDEKTRRYEERRRFVERLEGDPAKENGHIHTG